MEIRYSKSKVISSLFWKLMEKGGSQGVQLIIQILLARILVPDDFGTIAIATVFITILRLFVDSGFSTALIQKKNADEKDFSSIFYISLGIAILMYTLIFFTSPIISGFFDEDKLTKIIRVLSLTLFFAAFNTVQSSFVIRNMMFKKLFFSSFFAILISGIIGITAALFSFGVWALVFQQLSNQFFITLILWKIVKWRPKPLFSFKRVKSLFIFSRNVLFSRIIYTLHLNLVTLLIGKTYSPAMVGYYNRGEQLPRVIVENIDGSLHAVMFPTFSSEQDNNVRLKTMVRRAIMSSSFLIFPMMIGMAVVAKPLIIILLTEKWLAAVPFLQITSLAYAFAPIQSANLQAIIALGRSDIALKLEILKKIIGIIILIISIPFGIYAIAIGIGINVVISSFINAYPNKRLLNYNYIEQVIDVLPSLVIAACMGVIVYTFSYLNFGNLELLSLQIVVGTIIYILLSTLFKIEGFNYLLLTLKNTIKTRRDI